MITISHHPRCNLPEKVYICGTADRATPDVDGEYTANYEKTRYESSEHILEFYPFGSPRWAIRPNSNAPVTFYNKDGGDLWSGQWRGKNLTHLKYCSENMKSNFSCLK